MSGAQLPNAERDRARDRTHRRDYRDIVIQGDSRAQLGDSYRESQDTTDSYNTTNSHNTYDSHDHHSRVDNVAHHYYGLGFIPVVLILIALVGAANPYGMLDILEPPSTAPEPTKAAPFTVPFARDPYHIPRQDITAHLEADENGVEHNRVALYGMGGVGSADDVSYAFHLLADGSQED